jgi:hypothetical protein
VGQRPAVRQVHARREASVLAVQHVLAYFLQGESDHVSDDDDSDRVDGVGDDHDRGDHHHQS